MKVKQSKKAILSRRSAIKQLIKTHEIEDQESLIKFLKRHYGIETNQPAISRDLHELGVRKGAVGGKLIYELERDVEHEILRLAVVDIVYNEVLLIVKTIPGLADFVGDYLDSYEETEMLGTIAGENMVFVAPLTTKNMHKNFERLCTVLQFKKRTK